MMKKKQVAILVASIIVAVIVIVVVLFNIKTYDIMYNTNGGSFVATERVRVFSKATRPADPVRDGYTFDNWYYDDGIFDFDTRITQDMIIEARWVEGSPVAGTYIVSFNSNGGSSIASIKSNLDGTVNQPDDPVREGYRFVAWQYQGEDFDFSETITSNITLVAKWEEEGDISNSVPAEKVTLSPTTVSLRVGNTRRISVTLSPTNAINRTMIWSTSNSKVATVDNNGTVKAIGVGTATITVSVDGIKASVTVTVAQAATAPTTPTTPTNPTTPSNPTTPEEPTPVDPIPDEPTPEVPETYSIVSASVQGSATGEYMYYIYGSKRGYVSGTIRVTLLGGTVVEEQVSTAGIKFPQAIVQNMEIVSTN